MSDGSKGNVSQMFVSSFPSVFCNVVLTSISGTTAGVGRYRAPFVVPPLF